MSEINREELSAFMDGELKDGHGNDVVDHLLADETSRRVWMRYHLISEAMRRSLPSHLDQRLAASISTRLRDEPTVLRPSRKKFSTFIKPAAGLAIAASVASIAIIGVQQQRREEVTPGVSDTPVAAVQPIQAQIPAERQFHYPARPASIDSTLGSASAGTGTGRPAAIRASAETGLNSRLNKYLINYNEYHANAGMQGMLPYVRIVAHDRDE